MPSWWWSVRKPVLSPWPKNGVLIRRLDRQNLFNLLQEEIIPPETAEAQKQPLLNRLLNKGGAGKHAKTNAAR